MAQKPFDIITIGGSAGSFFLLIELLENLPQHFCVPVVIVLHRKRNAHSEMDKVLSVNKSISEPEDKQQLEDCSIYLAPQNYHLMIEEDKTFSLDYSEPVHYCRPSIDVSFTSFAEVYGSRVLGILLSGANADGAEGLDAIVQAGGTGIVQAPETAAYPAMPRAAMELNKGIMPMNPSEISKFLNKVIV